MWSNMIKEVFHYRSHISKHRGSVVRALALQNKHFALDLPNLFCLLLSRWILIFDVNEMGYLSASPISFAEILQIHTAIGYCLHSPPRCQCFYMLDLDPIE